MSDTVHNGRPSTGLLGRVVPRVAPVLQLSDVAVWRGDRPAVRDVTMAVHRHEITALIGPPGSGTAVVLRAVNRMLDHEPGVRVTGRITYLGGDVYAPDVDPARLCRLIGWVAAQPVLLRRSIGANVAYAAQPGPGRGEVVQQALRRVGLWPHVHRNLRGPARRLPPVRQRMLCIARALAAGPAVLLFDDPCAGLDTDGTRQIEDVIGDLAADHTILLSTGNRHQAARLATRTAVFATHADAAGVRYGRLVEYGHTAAVFTNPEHPDTGAYISGRSG